MGNCNARTDLMVTEHSGEKRSKLRLVKDITLNICVVCVNNSRSESMADPRQSRVRRVGPMEAQPKGVCVLEHKNQERRQAIRGSKLNEVRTVLGQEIGRFTKMAIS